jgi:lipopolysaccharide export system permease protein
LLWFGSRYWIPKANVIRSSFQSKYVDRNDPLKNVSFGSCYSCFYLRIDSNTFVGIRDYDSLSRTARGFFMEKIKGDKVVYNIRAEVMKWDTATKNWKLTNAAERYIDSLGERFVQHPEFTLNIQLKHSELRKDAYAKDKLTTPQLKEFIKQETMRGTEGMNTLYIEQYRRTATPFAVFLLTMIGAVIASRKSRGGSGLHLAIGITIAALFIISDRFSTVFATKGNFPPLLAAWLPNIVFAVVAYLLYRKTPK